MKDRAAASMTPEQARQPDTAAAETEEDTWATKTGRSGREEEFLEEGRIKQGHKRALPGQNRIGTH